MNAVRGRPYAVFICRVAKLDYLAGMTKIVLWVYVVLLVAGGFMGYLKAGSMVSLVTSTAFAIPLALCALGILPLWVGRLLTAVLAGFFVFRVIKTQKFMPAGMMAVVSAIVLLLLFLL